MLDMLVDDTHSPCPPDHELVRAELRFSTRFTGFVLLGLSPHDGGGSFTPDDAPADVLTSVKLSRRTLREIENLTIAVDLYGADIHDPDWLARVGAKRLPLVLTRIAADVIAGGFDVLSLPAVPGASEGAAEHGLSRTGFPHPWIVRPVCLFAPRSTPVALVDGPVYATAPRSTLGDVADGYRRNVVAGV